MNLLHALFGKRPPKVPPKASAPVKAKNGKPGKTITRAAYKAYERRVSSEDLAALGMSNKPRNARK